MKAWTKIGLLAAAVAVALPAAAQEVTLKFHHIWNTQAMASVNVINPWCEKIAKDSNNRLKCQIFPAMSLGGTPPQLVDQVKDGVTDLTITLPGYTAGRFPAMEVFELPFMTNSAEAAAQAAWEYLQKYATREFPGTKILAVWTHDEGLVHTKDKQVKTLEDFKGLKMRAPTRQTNKLLASLGAAPVGMPLPAIPDAISKGTIDGFTLPWEPLPSLKLQEMVKYHTETHPSRPSLYSAVFIFGMNQAKYDSLPADLKKVIDDNSGMALSKQIGAVWDASRGPARKLAQDRGNVFLELSPAETDRWIAASAKLYDEWVDDMNKRGLPGKQMLDDARALLAKYKK
ncbi:TRAP transporter substrate-binding protein [Calidifontimicrobium sp. SYSU G02091]|uniref:TRAP transporter substrate-binding protein n=1 Tax=Calidifontimicrobium sp. SYSU G02091 TaxID=2926421 RepID=UPI001F53B383|nr:TRAP transporter substrate-binding protein [Calidifontimicrobium sp. SYSU G02091]MCI1191227.1 TRAP transporter substrate-binding protein [Calidifontimicrobium sp. SYSU G02091]